MNRSKIGFIFLISCDIIGFISCYQEIARCTSHSYTKKFSRVGLVFLINLTKKNSLFNSLNFGTFVLLNFYSKNKK